MSDSSQFFSVAKEAAREAGTFIKSKWQTGVTVEYKGAINLVTEVDRQAEKLIVTHLQKNFPTHDILAEEGSGQKKDSDYRWVIDPLDGTTNFAHGYPLFAVSLALQHKGQTVLGIVYEPLREELFHALKNGGAFLNDKKISVSKVQKLDRALVATGFAYNLREAAHNNIDEFQRVLLKAQAVRRDGVAAIDLCYVACGRYDGFWEGGLFPWDVAAGVLAIEEAGGRVTRFDGSSFSIFDKEILVTNGCFHEEISNLLTQVPKGA